MTSHSWLWKEDTPLTSHPPFRVLKFLLHLLPEVRELHGRSSLKD